MAGAGGTISLAPGSDQTVTLEPTVTAFGPNGHRFYAGLMEGLREWLGGQKVAEQLAAIFRCDVRSAKRYLAGDRLPDGNHIAIILEHPTLGPKAAAYMVEWMVRHLTHEQQERMRVEIGRSACRALMLDRQSTGVF